MSPASARAQIEQIFTLRGRSIRKASKNKKRHCPSCFGVLCDVDLICGAFEKRISTWGRVWRLHIVVRRAARAGTRESVTDGIVVVFWRRNYYIVSNSQSDSVPIRKRLILFSSYRCICLLFFSDDSRQNLRQKTSYELTTKLSTQSRSECGTHWICRSQREPFHVWLTLTWMSS